MVLKDWRNAFLDKGDRKLGNVWRVYSKKGGGKPPFADSIELRKIGDKWHLIGGYWDSVFESKNEALAFALDYMREH